MKRFKGPQNKIPFSTCRDPEHRSDKNCVCGGHNSNNKKKSRKSKQRSKNLRSSSRKRS